jgi:spermidine/putrescine transport system permease protein
VISVAWGHRLLLLSPALIAAGLWAWIVLERRVAGLPRRPGFFRRNGWPVGTYLIVAVVIWLLGMVLLPQLFMIELSFRPKLPLNQVGGPRDLYTLENYRYFLFGSTYSSDAWNTVHLRAFATTIVSAMVIAALNLAICYPVAFYMAQVAKGARLRLLLLMLIAPYWVNEILRAFAFRVLFSAAGLFNTLLMGAGVITAPIDFIGRDIALFAGLAYAYTLLMVFPLYNALDDVEPAQIEAARDLGAPWWHIHLFVVMPAAKAGIASGCTLVFMLATGALAAPLVLGGTSALWFTPIVYDRFYQVFNWPQGAAYAFALLATCIVLVTVVLRLLRLNLTDVMR